ncbi:uncharacterized protein V6R79_026461 [Siganus canaliculatus]
MAEIQATMEQGKTMKDEDKLHRFNGVLYPIIPCPPQQLQALGKFQARPDDILLVAYPKCGFNWMTGVLKKIVTEATGKTNESAFPPLIEFMGADALKEQEDAPSPRILGTHMHPDNIPPSFYAQKTKMLVVFRNPKDTLVSYYHFTNNMSVLPKAKSWDAFYSDFMSGEVCWGLYFDHIVAWEKKMDDPNVLIVTYEEMKKDLSKGVRDISSFFGFNLTEAQLQKIAEGSTFKAMKESAENKNKVGDAVYRKGEVGDWKNHFSPEQSKQMDAAFSKYLAGTRLGQRLDPYMLSQ